METLAVREADGLDTALDGYVLLQPYTLPQRLVDVDRFIFYAEKGKLKVFIGSVNGSDVAAAALADWGSVQVLEYMVVVPSSRGLGLGTTLLSHILTSIPSGTPLVATLPDPATTESTDVHAEIYGDMKDRLEFYLRHGGKLLGEGSKLTLPEVHPGFGRPDNLLALHLAGPVPTKEVLEEWLTKAFHTFEGKNILLPEQSQVFIQKV